MLKFFRWIAGLFKAKPEEIQIPKPSVPVVDVLPEKIVQPVIKPPAVVAERFKRRIVKKSKEKFETSYIKVFGMQRTGTTFLEKLCSENFKNTIVFNNTFGWKHGRPLRSEKFGKWPEKYEKNSETRIYYDNIVSEVKDGNKVKFIVIIKNPYSWYYSIRRYRRSRFSASNLSKEYKTYSNRYRDYKDLYKRVVSDIYGEGCIVLYEDLISEPTAVLRNISEEFDVELAHKPIIIPQQVDQSRVFNEKQKKFYLSGGNFKLTQYLIDIINDSVDWQTLGFFDYKRIEKGE